MPTFALIQNWKAHWVFIADKLPPLASYIQVVDVTGMSPPVQEGFIFNKDGTFSAPPDPLPPPPDKRPAIVSALTAMESDVTIPAKIRAFATALKALYI